MHKGFHCRAGDIGQAAKILTLSQQIPASWSPAVEFIYDIFTCWFSRCCCSRRDLPAEAEMSAEGSGCRCAALVEGVGCSPDLGARERPSASRLGGVLLATVQKARIWKQLSGLGTGPFLQREQGSDKAKPEAVRPVNFFVRQEWRSVC